MKHGKDRVTTKIHIVRKNSTENMLKMFGTQDLQA